MTVVWRFVSLAVAASTVLVSTTPQQDLATKTSGVGESCGGLNIDPATCADGLVCVFPTGIGILEDPGTCMQAQTLTKSSTLETGEVMIVGVGEACGGLNIKPASCADGLKCSFPTGPRLPEAPGTCVVDIAQSSFIVTISSRSSSVDTTTMTKSATGNSMSNGGGVGGSTSVGGGSVGGGGVDVAVAVGAVLFGVVVLAFI